MIGSQMDKEHELFLFGQVCCDGIGWVNWVVLLAVSFLSSLRKYETERAYVASFPAYFRMTLLPPNNSQCVFALFLQE